MELDTEECDEMQPSDETQNVDYDNGNAASDTVDVNLPSVIINFSSLNSVIAIICSCVGYIFT